MQSYYLHPQNESGVYSAPQDTPFEGAIALNADQLQTFLAFKGFGTVSDGLFSGAQTALDAWNAAHPDTPEPTPAPQITTAELSDAVCEMDATYAARISEAEDALCALDAQINGGTT